MIITLHAVSVFAGSASRRASSKTICANVEAINGLNQIMILKLITIRYIFNLYLW
jgi:hypothetical protein